MKGQGSEAAEGRWGSGTGDGLVIQPQTREGSAEGIALVFEDAPGSRYDTAVTRCFRELLGTSLAMEASDLHLEQSPAGVRLRWRVAGRLQAGPELPPALAWAVLERAKLLAGMGSAGRTRTQDGRFGLLTAGGRVDIRASVLPLVDGESVVLRFLPVGSDPPGLDDLGMPPAVRSVWLDALGMRDGLLLVAGPTGSGKSTTLRASASTLVAMGRRVVTVEDPVEYTVAGAIQIPVNRVLGLSFGVALKTALRQNPDCLVVGEVRDGESASVAVEAALTGHLVLASVHALHARLAGQRLVGLGVEVALTRGALRLSLGQILHSATRAPTGALGPGGGESGGGRWLRRAHFTLERGSGVAAWSPQGIPGFL